MRTYRSSLAPLRHLELSLRSRMYLAGHPEEQELIQRNSEFRALHRGERCFILGNGPSLSTEDVSLLRDDVVFTVNNLTREHIQGVRPRFHVISDRRFFSLDSAVVQDQVMLATLRSIFLDPQRPLSFVPTTAAEFIRVNALDNKGGVNYFCNPFYFSDYYRVSNDVTKVIPRFSSVVHHAIIIATFMGFTEIYLLGCDATNIVANINTALQVGTSGQYCYPVSADLDEWFKQQLGKRNMERCAESYLEVLVGFRYLFDYCRNRGVRLVNCSSQSVIDSIPRRTLSEVL